LQMTRFWLHCGGSIPNAFRLSLSINRAASGDVAKASPLV
jgi:hypothetical protein